MPPAPPQAPSADLAQRRADLLPALWDVQQRDGYISAAAVKAISHALRVPEAEIYGVIGFYSLFSDQPTPDTVIRVCTSPVCRAAGAERALHELRARLDERAGGELAVEHTTCLGLCEHAPAVLVTRRGEGLRAGPLTDLDALLAGSAPVPVLVGAGEGRILPPGDPTRAETLAEYGDYAALRRAVTQGTPEAVIAEVEAAGLMGRGGAAFPTGRKWRFTRAAPGATRYAVCNADESEPGTFKDRALLELRPHAVLEGLALCGYAIGAAQGVIFIRGEYPAAQAWLEAALAEARVAGLLGERLFGTDFSFDVTIRRGAGAYICGEETALFEAVEGKRGFPRIKPPFPTTHGLFGQPTSVNNVETLVCAAQIVGRGAAWFRERGTADSPGTKLVCVSGGVRRPGVYEIPFGLPLRALLEERCGGVVGDLQAVLMGGAAGTFLTPGEIDVPLSFEGLRAIGASLGSGAVMVFNDTVDLRDVLASLAEFFQDESCGKCYPCQLGTQRQLELIRRLGSPLPGDAERLRDVGATMTEASLCGLGQTAALAILSALERWPRLLADGGDRG